MYVSALERTQLMEEGIISQAQAKVRKVEPDEEDRDFECYDRSERKPVHIDKEITERNKPTLALLPNRSEEYAINKNGETRDRAVILTYADQTEYLNHRNAWVMYQRKITLNIFTGPTRKEAPKLRLKTTEEIESDYDPNENDGYYENK